LVDTVTTVLRKMGLPCEPIGHLCAQSGLDSVLTLHE
jgi:hypothetical protein